MYLVSTGVWRSTDNGSRCIVQVHEIVTTDKVMFAQISQDVFTYLCPFEISHILNLVQAGNVTVGKVDGAPARPDSPPPGGETATTGRIDDVTLV